MSAENMFVKLAAIDVSQHIEKKQNLSYLSWAWALDQLMRHDPQSNWTFNEPTKFGETMMVSCTVTAFGKPITMHLPVMDHRNQAIKNPDAFQVNKNMMRCLVKAIACHGLGLYIYAGEDLPSENDAPIKSTVMALPASSKSITKSVWDELEPDEQNALQAIADEAIAIFTGNGPADTLAFLHSQGLNTDEKVALFSRFDSKMRSALKTPRVVNDQQYATQP